MFLLKLVSQLLYLVKKNLLHSEHMQIEFLQSGIFPQSGIQILFTSYKNLATQLYFLPLFYPHSGFLNLCETCSLCESQAQDYYLTLSVDVLKVH